MRKHWIILFIIFFSSTLANGQTKKIEVLEAEIKINNDSLQYEKSIIMIDDFIASASTTHYEKCYAYIFKANTYKYLFNYTKTLYNLDQAQQEGLATNNKNEILQIIKAEKALLYFDILQFERADTLMKELAATNYKYLSDYTKAWIFTQEGHSLMLAKKFDLAEKRLDEAISISLKKSPDQLPVIYGKKIELFEAMGEYKKRDSLFSLAIDMAKASNHIKYQMYLYQTMNHIYDRNRDYKNAFNTHRLYDSLDHQFQPNIRSSQLDLLEKNLNLKNKESILKTNMSVIFILIGVILSLLILIYYLTKLFKLYKRERDLIEHENKLITSEIQSLTKKLEENKNGTLDLSKFQLSERQMQIIELLRQGKSNKEIAESLYISENTVKYHLKSIYEILDIRHRSEIK